MYSLADRYNRMGMEPIQVQQPQQQPVQQQQGGMMGGMDPSSMMSMFGGGGGASGGGATGGATGGSNMMGGFGNFMGGWGGVGAAVGATELVRPDARRQSEKIAPGWGGKGSDILSRGGQGAMIGGQIMPGWGHLIGGAAGLSAGRYETDTGNNLGSGNFWKDLGKSQMSGMPLAGYSESKKHDKWKRVLFSPNPLGALFT